MKTRSVLVYVPGMPFDAGSLHPQRTLAGLAGVLLEEGHETRILDWGTVNGLASLGRPGLRAAARAGLPGKEPAGRLWRRILGGNPATALERLLEETAVARTQEAAQTISAMVDLDFAVFLLRNRADFLATLPVARLLKKMRPEVRRIGMGPYIEEYGAAVLTGSTAFDALCLGDVELAIGPLAERITRPERWGAVPNLLYSESGQIRRTPFDAGAGLEDYPRPVYHPEVYPALEGHQKFKVFTLEQSRGCHHVPHHRPEIPWSARQVRLMPVDRICDAMDRLGREMGAGAFHFAGASTPASHAERLSAELAMRYGGLPHSREGHFAYADPASMHAMRASGCLAAGFTLDTGSQRLLEDYYGHSFCVSQAEAVLRAVREAGILSSVRLTYPCPMDDYHTAAETVRILQRTQPNGVTVLPVSTPIGSRWKNEAAEFGFHIQSKGFMQWAGFPRARGPWEADRDKPPYRMAQWTQDAATQSRNALDTEIRELGIPSDMNEHWALLGAIGAEPGQEEAFCAQGMEALAAYDAPAISHLVKAFNTQAAIPVNTVAFRPFRPILAVVGN